MLPLQPPGETPEPAYPSRQRLCADVGLSRKALAVLAAATLSACGSGDAGTEGTTGKTPTNNPEPTAPPGVPPIPQQVDPEPEPQPLAGEAMPVEQPEPVELGGDIAPVELPEPATPKLAGLMIATPPKPKAPDTDN